MSTQKCCLINTNKQDPDVYVNSSMAYFFKQQKLQLSTFYITRYVKKNTINFHAPQNTFEMKNKKCYLYETNIVSFDIF